MFWCTNGDKCLEQVQYELRRLSLYVIVNASIKIMDKSRLKAAHTGMLYYSLTEWTLSFCICGWRWIWCMGWSQLSSPQWDWWGSEMWLWPPHPFCHSAGEWCHSWFLTVSMCAFMTLFSLAYSKQGFCAHYIFLISLCIAQLGLMQCLSIDLLCP